MRLTIIKDKPCAPQQISSIRISFVPLPRPWISVCDLMPIWTRLPDTLIAGFEYVEIGSTSLSTITRISSESNSMRGAMISNTKEYNES
jgi:hypothetical protein